MDDNLNSLFIALRKYFDYFRAHSGMSFPMPQGIAPMNVTPKISEEELVGLITWVQLATTLAEKNPEARRHIYEDRGWNCIENVTGLLTCSVPLVLKGNLYKFLASLAIDEGASVHIWNCVLREGICSQMANGKLSGVQQDLEEQECVLKVYDCSQGYLCLMQELFRHKTRPGANQMGPHLQFIVKSIICQFSSRSYKDPQQMWELVKLGLDCLNELLRMFYVTPMAVRNKSSEVQLLGQLLNDSPLSKNLISVITEGQQCWMQSGLLNQPHCLFAGINNVHGHTGKSNMNCLSLLLLYFVEIESFTKHVFYVMKILREVSCQRPSLQLHVVQSSFSMREYLMDSFSRVTAVFAQQLEVLQTDIVPENIEACDPARIRGEIARYLLEVCIDALESDAKAPNLAYLLLGFNLRDIQNSDISFNNKSTDGLRNILEIANTLCSSDHPFEVPFSGLYEPALRVLLKLASFGSAISPIIIRHLRSHGDLVYQLATSTVFRQVVPIDQRIRVSCDVSCSTMILQKSIQGIILELIALELSALIRMGHMEQPKNYLVVLLSTPTEYSNGHNESFAGSEKGLDCKALLWSLLDQSRMDIEELAVPVCTKFDKEKIDELLRFCVRKNSCNVDQFDIEYLHLLLNTEVNSILNSEIGIIKAVSSEILEFCAQHNARNLLEGACIHLLSGWLSVVNVLSLSAPFRLFIQINIKRLSKSQILHTLFPIVHLLLTCLVLPGYSKCVRFKMDMYGSILIIFDTCNKAAAVDKELEKVEVTSFLGGHQPTRDSLAEMMEEERERKNLWSKIFESITSEVISTIASDITFAPLSLKIVATSCLSDIIREDIVQSQQVAHQFVFSGSMRCVLDSLSRVVYEFRGDAKTKQNEERKHKQLLLIKALFSLFVRLAASECGWTALVDGKILQQICGEQEPESASKMSASSPESIMRQLLLTMTKL
uniref:Uncharacterized protein n=1 Tax=Ditylenchus dipsaci TaxID=166011 RepID=A0A915DWS5_9BILA